MNSFILTLRAIGAHLAMRLYIPAVALAAVVAAVIVVITFWLTTLGEWWWLLFIPLVSVICIVSAVSAVVLLLIRYVQPRQTKEQRQAVKRFVDKIQGVAEIAGTPKVIILFRVVRSISAPKKDSYLSDLVANKELVNDFRELQQLFRP